LVYIFKESQDCLPELLLGSVEASIDNFLAHELPQAFYQVQVGEIGRKKYRLYLCVFQPFDKFLIPVVAGVVCNNVIESILPKNIP
jgi:hypothetical protein